MTVELDEKYVKIEEFTNTNKAVVKKIDVQNEKLKKLKSEIDSKHKELDFKIDEKMTIKEFKNYEEITEGTLELLKNDIKIAKKRDFSHMSPGSNNQDLSKLKLGSGTNKKFSHLSNNNPFSIRAIKKSETKLDSLNEADEDSNEEESNNNNNNNKNNINLRTKSSKNNNPGQNEDEVIEEEIEEDQDIDKGSMSKIEKAKNVIAARQARLS